MTEKINRDYRKSHTNEYDEIITRAIVRSISAQATGEIAAYLARWARTGLLTVDQSEELTRVNKEAVEEARDAMLRRYLSVSRRLSYRSKDPGKLKRDADGAMIKALNQPGVFSATDKGIFFMDKSLMDKKARQWYRLNFGAYPASTPPRTIRAMKWKGRSVARPDFLKKYKPSEKFYMPKGVFSQSFGPSTRGIKSFKASAERGYDAFYVIRKGFTAVHQKTFKDIETGKTMKYKPTIIRPISNRGERLPTKGIRGERFIEEGMAAFNDAYPKKIEELFKRWAEETTRKTK